MKPLTVGSLFAGIGGFDLGLERTGGFRVVWQCEIDPYCQRVLAKHWPHVTRYGDIRELRDVERVDVLCGGFPCQDISNAGKRAGIDGERSGLWSEYVRVIRELRPRYVIVENVAALLGRGMGRVLGDLSESGYDAEWDIIRASDVGAPHRRERVWLVAYSRHLCGGNWTVADEPAFPTTSIRGSVMANPKQQGLEGHWQHGSSDCGGTERGWASKPAEIGCDVADSESRRLQGSNAAFNNDIKPGCQWASEFTRGGSGKSEAMAHTSSGRQSGSREYVFQSRPSQASDWEASDALTERFRDFWRVEPNVGRVANGISARMDRLKGLGNAIVPQIAEWIGNRILESEGLKQEEL